MIEYLSLLAALLGIVIVLCFMEKALKKFSSLGRGREYHLRQMRQRRIK